MNIQNGDHIVWIWRLQGILHKMCVQLCSIQNFYLAESEKNIFSTNKFSKDIQMRWCQCRRRQSLFQLPTVNFLSDKKFYCRGSFQKFHKRTLTVIVSGLRFRSCFLLEDFWFFFLNISRRTARGKLITNNVQSHETSSIENEMARVRKRRRS